MLDPHSYVCATQNNILTSFNAPALETVGHLIIQYTDSLKNFSVPALVKITGDVDDFGLHIVVGCGGKACLILRLACPLACPLDDMCDAYVAWCDIIYCSFSAQENAALKSFNAPALVKIETSLKARVGCGVMC